MKRWGICVLVLALLGGGIALPAQAQSKAEREEYLRFCNKHHRKVQVAVAWASGEKTGNGRDIFISKGWYGIEPGKCSTPVKGSLRRYYYYYAQDADERTWEGDYPMCITEKAFNIKSTQCGEGYKRRNFYRIDTKGRSLIMDLT